MSAQEFKESLEVEGIISFWLESNYFKKDSVDYHYTRCTIPKLQKRGVDASIINQRIFKDEKPRYIDEKAASSYIKTDLKADSLPTFAFELDCKRKDSADVEDRVPGWLFGEQYDSVNYYLISWIWADVPERNGAGDIRQVNLMNIKKAECLLIEKDAIQKWVLKYGINSSNFMEKAKKARDHPQRKILLRNKGTTPNIQHSNQLPESPVNLVISKYHLRQMAVDSFEVIL